MIVMYCDACGEEIPREVNGSMRLRMGSREIVFHLCATHREELHQHVIDMCQNLTPRGTQPSLKKEEERHGRAA